MGQWFARLGGEHIRHSREPRQHPEAPGRAAVCPAAAAPGGDDVSIVSPIVVALMLWAEAEKSGAAGLTILQNFAEAATGHPSPAEPRLQGSGPTHV